MTYYKTINVAGRYVDKHRLIAEEALGRILRREETVHHVDGDETNDNHENLVICPDQAYHKLLHIRTSALDISGNANYRQCDLCKQYDDPAHMSFTPKNKAGSYRHKGCNAAYARERRRLKWEGIV